MENPVRDAAVIVKRASACQPSDLTEVTQGSLIRGVPCTRASLYHDQQPGYVRRCSHLISSIVPICLSNAMHRRAPSCNAMQRFRRRCNTQRDVVCAPQRSTHPPQRGVAHCVRVMLQHACNRLQLIEMIDVDHHVRLQHWQSTTALDRCSVATATCAPDATLHSRTAGQHATARCNVLHRPTTWLPRIRGQ